MKALFALMVALLAVFSTAVALPATDVPEADFELKDETKEANDADSSNEEKGNGDSYWYITKSNFMLPYEEADGNCFFYVTTTYVRNTYHQLAFHTYEVDNELYCWSDN